jgi:phosphatidylglycerophosphate synthase
MDSYRTKEFGTHCYTDYLIYKLVIQVDKICFKLNMTPNMITTLSIPFIILGIYFFSNNNYLCIPCILIYVFLDYLDGYYARNHDMVTEFGDWYDHFRDVVCFILLFIIIIYKIYRNKKYIIFNVLFLIILLSSLILSLIRFGCNERLLPNEHNKTLNIIKNMCSDQNILNHSQIICLSVYFIFFSIFMAILIKQDSSNVC